MRNNISCRLSESIIDNFRDDTPNDFDFEYEECYETYKKALKSVDGCFYHILKDMIDDLM